MDKAFWVGSNPEKPGFFEVVTVTIDGRDVKVMKGLLEAGMRCVKRFQSEIITAAKAGQEFAKGIANGGS